MVNQTLARIGCQRTDGRACSVWQLSVQVRCSKDEPASEHCWELPRQAWVRCVVFVVLPVLPPTERRRLCLLLHIALLCSQGASPGGVSRDDSTDPSLSCTVYHFECVQAAGDGLCVDKSAQLVASVVRQSAIISAAGSLRCFVACVTFFLTSSRFFAEPIV